MKLLNIFIHRSLLRSLFILAISLLQTVRPDGAIFILFFLLRWILQTVRSYGTEQYLFKTLTISFRLFSSIGADSCFFIHMKIYNCFLYMSLRWSCVVIYDFYLQTVRPDGAIFISSFLLRWILQTVRSYGTEYYLFKIPTISFRF
jgi:hypothetical protein